MMVAIPILPACMMWRMLGTIMGATEGAEFTNKGIVMIIDEEMKNTVV